MLASYRQTVLDALAQVADTLRALEHDAETLSAQADAVHAAFDALHLTHINYQAGIATYLQLLIADEQYPQATLAYVQAQAQRLQAASRSTWHWAVVGGACKNETGSRCPSE